MLQDCCSVLIGVGVPRTLTPQKVKHKKFSFEEAVQVWKNLVEWSWHQQKRVLAGRVNKWEKGASGKILLLLMEHLSKAASVKSAFE